MPNCKLTGGIAIDCSDKTLGAGGVKQKAWVFNRGDLIASFSNSDNTVVTGFTSTAGYTPLFPFQLLKGSSFTLDGIQNETGIAYFPHSVTLSTLDVSGDAIASYEELVRADELCVIVETTGGQFLLLGYDRGLTVTASPRESGVNPSDGTSRQITLSGEQASAQKIVLNTDYATTLAMILGFQATV